MKTAFGGAEPNRSAILRLPYEKCGRTGCINRGIWGLKICVPPTGKRLFQHAPMTCLVGVSVCDSHIEGVRAEEFITTELMNMLSATARKANKIQPDFRRAYMDGVPVNEKEWTDFKAASAKVRPR